MAVPPSQVTVNDGIALPGRSEALTTPALRPLSAEVIVDAICRPFEMIEHFGFVLPKN